MPIAQFFSIFLPGSAGDDLTRMLYISRLAPGRVGEACATVLLDRFIGLTSVLLLALFCVPWQWSLMSDFKLQTHWIAVGYCRPELSSASAVPSFSWLVIRRTDGLKSAFAFARTLTAR